MFNLKRGTVAAVVVSFGLFTTLGTAVAGPATEANKDIAQMLRAGGFIIVVRHGATFPDRADTDPLNFDNVAAQRNLNDKGKVLAKAFGDAVRRVGIPVSKVYTSKYNRAYETAVIAGFKDIEKTADLTEGGLVVSPNENNRRIEAFHKMLGTAPQPGTNTILITHKPNIVGPNDFHSSGFSSCLAAVRGGPGAAISHERARASRRRRRGFRSPSIEALPTGGWAIDKLHDIHLSNATIFIEALGLLRVREIRRRVKSM
jgi:phosphohistidine phosphatase SixA